MSEEWKFKSSIRPKAVRRCAEFGDSKAAIAANVQRVPHGRSWASCSHWAAWARTQMVCVREVVDPALTFGQIAPDDCTDGRSAPTIDRTTCSAIEVTLSAR